MTEDELTGGILQEHCGELLISFFTTLRGDDHRPRGR
jgi:hypothetical protein